MPSYNLINSYNAGGDITKQWFVHYHYLIPKELKKPGRKTYERFKVYNTIKNPTSRNSPFLAIVKSNESHYCYNINYSVYKIPHPYYPY